MLYFYFAVFLIIGGILTTSPDWLVNIILAILGLIFLPVYPIFWLIDKYLFG